ncbi:site-specific integrase [Bradyrhizobium tropiciagri]|uniref:site-specific integrase n=1 Tax=Bradyrhizobium tropiciagri TaxID=312253 RepID=UPI001BAB9C2D|nr:site-specific integrase [Bradyrhizobium tropiciagri]MBR0870299.1 site-specific integrase [Bradyrhizobium tropiciagri]
MRALMGLIKDRHGTYYAQKRVPERLREAVALVLKADKRRQVFLKRSLGTKVLKDANTRAKPVLMEFDRTLSAAEALLKRPSQAKPLRTSLNDAEIKRMAEYVYAKALAWDERTRYGRDELKRIEAEHERLEGRPLSGPWAFPYETLPADGLSPAQLSDRRQQLGEDLEAMRERLALGDISAVQEHIEDALDAFDIKLDRQGTAFPRLGIEVLRAYVHALKAIGERNEGEPVPTPRLAALPTAAASGTLREAFNGWQKKRDRPEGTVHEYGRAIEMFIQLHGNLPVLEIRRSHARTFREALQLVPKSRKGPLLKASLPELSDYGRAHPTLQMVSPGTVNKQLGAVQAIAGWGRHNGLVPEDAPWSDPFEEMRLDEEQSQREPFDARDLQTIFNAPLFTEHKLPLGAKGAAGIWLPLLALFAGARQAEYAGLRVSDIREDGNPSVPLMWFTRDTKAGRRLKTKSSERVVPVHPQLVGIGFLKYVAERRREGEQAWLFPTVAPDQKGALRAWAKWWGRHLRNHVGVKNTNKVFHSFRHGFQDALRQATPDEELRDALAGRSSGKSVSRRYGAKAMLDRWGVTALKTAIDNIAYPGLNLSRVRTSGLVRRTRATKAA